MSTTASRPNGSRPDLSSLTDGRPAMAYALNQVRKRSHSNASSTNESSSAASDSEDYDDLRYDPDTVMADGEGAGVDKKLSRPEDSDDSAASGALHIKTLNTIPLKSRGEGGRRKSVQVVIEKSAKKGGYTLTADDPEFREIVRSSIEREAARLSGKTSRSRFRDLVFTRQFTTFDRQNPSGAQSPFHGFFTLFWLAMAMLLLRVAAHNYKTQGSVYGGAEIVRLMVQRDLLLVFVVDGLMTFGTAFSFILQRFIVKGYLRWNKSGWFIQSVFQVAYLTSVIGLTFYRDWPWTHTVFIVMHALIYIMKQHSYSFYNGYLSQVYHRRRLLEEKLKQLESMESQNSPTSTNDSRPPQPSVATSLKLDESDRDGLPRRRRSVGSKVSTNFKKEESEIASMARAIESGEPLDSDQVLAFTHAIKPEIQILTEELQGKCTHSNNTYPNNLTLANFADWTCLPTLVYELEYPRQERINWWYVAEKTSATIGVIWIMIIISQAYIYPVVASTVRQKEAGVELQERWQEFPWVVSDMLFPLLLEQLLSWYVIWECVLNVLAELTRFADRGFYGEWWNSTGFDQYARDWNRPVHAFLLRHVYHSSISAFHLSKTSATFFTFFLSAIVHELLMFCLFKKVRGYLFAMQLSQIPLAMLSRSKLLKGKDTLGNVIFWFGLFIGPSVITSLYLIV